MSVIAIMRPARYIIESVKLANSFGFDTVTAPMIDVIDKTDSNFKNFIKRIMEVESDYVIFTSANGVEFTLLKIREPEFFIEQLNKTTVVAIGSKTKEALIKNKIKVGFVPNSYSSEGLVEELQDLDGKIIDIARSSHGTPILIKGLIDKGAVVYETQVYEIIMPHDDRHYELIKKAVSGEIDIFAFTSSMMARNFMAIADMLNLKDEIIKVLNEKVVVAIGKPTSDTLGEYGIKVKAIPQRYTFEDMLFECKKLV